MNSTVHQMEFVGKDVLHSMKKSAHRFGKKIKKMPDWQGEAALCAKIKDAKGRTLCAMRNTYAARLPMLLLFLLLCLLIVMTGAWICHHRHKRSKHRHAVFCSSHCI